MIYSKNGDAGYNLIVDEFLIFQPIYSNDMLCLIYYRVYKGGLRRPLPKLTAPEKRKVVVSDTEIQYTDVQFESFSRV